MCGQIFQDLIIIGDSEDNNTKYNWNNNTPLLNARIIMIPYIYTDARCTRNKIMMKITSYSNGNTSHEWDWWFDNDPERGKVYHDTWGLYLFPLIGEDENDDTVSSVPNVEVENYTYVFPNPAREDVTVQCSFKIKSIGMFNEQGHKVLETRPNAYNTAIDVSKYPKGTYILKVSTQSGTATKKIVVQ